MSLVTPELLGSLGAAAIVTAGAHLDSPDARFEVSSDVFAREVAEMAATIIVETFRHLDRQLGDRHEPQS